jgi:sugar phosphate isomerase/epimerase
MHLSVATASFYFIPFEETLAIIAEAGFENIELDLFWEWKQWSMAQHLKGMPVRQVIQLINQFGLEVTSIHDGGGLLRNYPSVTGYINPILDEVLYQLGYAPDTLVFHPPQAEGELDGDWWERISGEIVCAMDPYRAAGRHLTLENMPLFAGFSVPLITPEALGAFTVDHGFGVTVDTTHYAQIGVDLLGAARILRDNIRSVHLSDFLPDRTHVFVGEGELDLNGFLSIVNLAGVDAVTLECSVTSLVKSDREMDHSEMVARLKLAKAKVEHIIGGI